MSFEDALKSAAVGYRDVSICLSGPLRHAWETRTAALQLLEQKIEEDRNSAPADARLGQKSPMVAAKQKLDKELEALKPDIAAASITLRFSALPFLKWNELVIATPPREGNVADRVWGYNTLDFYPAAMRLTGQKVEDGKASEITNDQWEQLEAVLTDAVMDDIAAAINQLNRKEGAGVPFSLADYAKTQD